MPFMTLGPDGGMGGPAGASYSGIFAIAPREGLVTTLSDLRFSGWVGPQEGRWVVTIPSRLSGAVARDKMTPPLVARAISAATNDASCYVLVRQDKLLQLQAYAGGEPILTYYSDPTIVDPYNDELSASPMGAQDAPALAAALGKPDVGEELEELLDEQLSESENESERLIKVLRLLEAPTWVVSSDALPQDIPAGPLAKELTRLGAGRPGIQGRVDDAVRGIVRKKK